MKFGVLALDYDRTIGRDDVLDPDVKAIGMRLLGATLRQASFSITPRRIFFSWQLEKLV